MLRIPNRQPRWVKATSRLLCFIEPCDRKLTLPVGVVSQTADWSVCGVPCLSDGRQRGAAICRAVWRLFRADHLSRGGASPAAWLARSLQSTARPQRRTTALRRHV